MYLHWQVKGDGVGRTHRDRRSASHGAVYVGPPRLRHRVQPCDARLLSTVWRTMFAGNFCCNCTAGEPDRRPQRASACSCCELRRYKARCKERCPVPSLNPPPGWPVPYGWQPPAGWSPDPSWPPAPPGCNIWIDELDVAPAHGSDPDRSRGPSSPLGTHCWGRGGCRRPGRCGQCRCHQGVLKRRTQTADESGTRRRDDRRCGGVSTITRDRPEQRGTLCDHGV